MDELPQKSRMVPRLQEQLARVGWQNDRTANFMFSQYPERHQEMLATIIGEDFSLVLIRKHLFDETDGKRINAFIMSAH